MIFEYYYNNNNNSMCITMKGIKTILLGDYNTGKSSLIDRLCYNKYTPIISSSIGVSFNKLDIKDETYHFWDTAGQERYMSVVKIYYRNSNIILYVFDMSNIETVERIANHFREIEHENSIPNYNNNYLVIGTKLDLVDINETDKIKKYVIDYIPGINSNNIVFTSSKDNIGFDIIKKKLHDMSYNIIIYNPEPIIIEVNKNKQSCCNLI